VLPTHAGLAALDTYLTDRLRAPLPGPDVQRRFCPQPARPAWDPAAGPADARRAGALLLLYPGPHGPTIALTRRRDDLRHHGGQISLPGGGVHAGEAPADAARREAHEEVGLDPAGVRVLGELSPLWVFVSGFVVHPVIALAEARPLFVSCPREVDLVIEAPLAALRDPRRLRWDRRLRQGAEVWVPYFDVDGHQVWGATAMMIGEFGALLDPAFGPGPRPPSPD
jgi:8-oxo-dGTP pyrophosphatase MutT (NUDIX family)